MSCALASVWMLVAFTSHELSQHLHLVSHEASHHHMWLWFELKPEFVEWFFVIERHSWMELEFKFISVVEMGTVLMGTEGTGTEGRWTMEVWSV
jgi:hypothetical protein